MIEPRSFGAPWLSGLRLALLVIMSGILALAPATAAYAGTVIEIAGIHSAVLPPQRARVWLPEGYGQGTRRYGVVYVHDGQAAFRAGAADEQNFAIDRTVAELVEAGRIEPVIIVAVFNPGADRFRQFLPYPIYRGSSGDLRSMLDKELGGRPVTSGAFLHYLARELKPAIDKSYRTLPEARHTTMIGASMGGLITAAAFIEHPDVFGRAACISPQWALYDARMIDHPSLLQAWPAYFTRLGPPAGRKLWLDHGTTMIDAGYGPYQAAIAKRLEAQGWKGGVNLETRVYEGGAHTWTDWSRNMPQLLAWLLA